MNRVRHLFLGFAAVTACGLASCGTESASAVRNPTVDEMAKLESQWGMKPQNAQPHVTTQQPYGAPAPSQAAQPAPEPVPLPAPAAPSQPAPASVDASTLQKLR